MRKITSLLMMLCMFVGTAWGQVAILLKDFASTPDQVFKLKNVASGRYMSVETAKAAEGTQIKDGVDDDKQKFFLIATPSEGYFFIQCASGEFIYKESSWTAKTETQPTAFLVEEVEDGVYMFYNNKNISGYLGPNKDAIQDGSPLYSNQAKNNPNATWVLEISTVDADVLDKAKEKRKSIAVTPTDFPNTQAFRLKNPNGHYLTLTTPEANAGFDVRASVDEDKQKFFLLSSPENDGYFLQNANTHAVKVVPGWHAQSNQQEASLFQIESPELATYKFKSTLGYFGVNPTGSENGDGSLNGAVVFSNQSSDNANVKWQFEFAEVADDVLDAAVAKREVYNNAYLAILLANWKEAELSKIGYVGGYPKEMVSDINAVATYADAKVFHENNNNKRISLTEGYYLLKGTGTGNNANWYVTYTGDSNTELKAMSGEIGIQHLWKFVADGDGYKLMSCNTGKYVTALSAAPAPSKIADEGVKFSFSHNTDGQFTIKDANDKVLRTEDSGVINFWEDAWGNENDETWYIIPATDIEITVGDEGYATTYLPFDVVVPNTVEAYAVTATSNEYATLTKMEDIPANNGAILKGEGTHTLSIAKANSDWTGNLLKGTNVSANITDAAYILAKNGENVGFYPVEFGVNIDEDAENEAFTNKANKAYLPASAVPSGVRFLSFDFGNETSIDELKSENGNVKTVVYDLSGRRVQKAQKGVFIVNGKVVIK